MRRSAAMRWRQRARHASFGSSGWRTPGVRLARSDQAALTRLYEECLGKAHPRGLSVLRVCAHMHRWSRVIGRRLGRRILAEIATIVTPHTIVRCVRFINQETLCVPALSDHRSS